MEKLVKILTLSYMFRFRNFFLIFLFSSLVQGCRETTLSSFQKQAAILPTEAPLSLPSPIKNSPSAQPPTRTQAPLSTQESSPSVSQTPTNDPLYWLHNTRLGDYLDIQSEGSVDLAVRGWRMYKFPSSQSRCIFGEEFFVLVRTGRDPTKTVFWMNGGGACWPGQEACANHFNLDRWDSESKLASQEENNPVRDWNFVFLPSCDGSFFMGDHQADYSKDGKPDHTHWGLRNTSAAISLVSSLFPKSQKILIAGCSAGGYGTLIAPPIVRLNFPNARLYVFNESGPGLFNPEQARTWKEVLDAWGLESVLPDDCQSCREQLVFLYSWMLKHDPNLRVGLYSSYHDSVIGNIYLGMSSSAFENLILSTTNEIHAAYPDTFKRYLIKGSAHCVTDYTRQSGGVSLFRWIAALIEEESNWNEIIE